MLRYSDLNIYQKQDICNGCGGKGSIIPVPNFLFEASCNRHDFYYWRGGKEFDRKIADQEFYRIMKRDIRRRKYSVFRPKQLAKLIWYKLWAKTYYHSVRLFGKKYFYYGDMRTANDLPL